jgi:AraC-like DNA-binding protein
MINYNILIIEDELIIAIDISNILEKVGYLTKIGITNAVDAFKELEINSYDLVLIDVKLKNNSNGIDIGAYLLEKNSVPYIYITSISDNVIVEQIKLTRPHGIIIKPYKPVDLITLVSIVLNNYKHRHIDVLRVPQKLQDETSFLLKNVIVYIDSNLNKKIDLHQLSILTKWSHQHFIKLFTHYLGQSPYQYILQKKIEKAKALIVETDIPLREIALGFGFESYSNFLNAFKKETGYTPDFHKKSTEIKDKSNKTKNQ